MIVISELSVDKDQCCVNVALLLLHHMLQYTLFYVAHVTAKPCSHPLSSDQANSVNITGITLTNPITEGTTAIFSCPLGQVLTGPNVSECMENGEWMPDTEEVQCTCVNGMSRWYLLTIKFS